METGRSDQKGAGPSRRLSPLRSFPLDRRDAGLRIRPGEKAPGRASTGRQIWNRGFGVRFHVPLMADYPFREGNTRTVAVFVILYLRRLGFTVGSEPFASHARYLRDALVLDNILNPAFKDPAPLRRFMERTLFNPSIELENLLKSSSMDSHRFGQFEGSRGDIPV